MAQSRADEGAASGPRPGRTGSRSPSSHSAASLPSSHTSPAPPTDFVAGSPPLHPNSTGAFTRPKHREAPEAAAQGRAVAEQWEGERSRRSSGALSGAAGRPGSDSDGDAVVVHVPRPPSFRKGAGEGMGVGAAKAEGGDHPAGPEEEAEEVADLTQVCAVSLPRPLGQGNRKAGLP